MSIAQSHDEEKNEFPLSAKGALWKIRDYDIHTARGLEQRFHLTSMVAQLLAQRGVTFDTAEDFLTPTLKHALPDPSHLLDMDKAVARIIQAVQQQEAIVIFGDYDVDGATSSALLKRYFAMLGVQVKVYIPDRMQEGYGLNSEALLELRAQGADVCISVDCGTVSFEPIAKASQAGLDVIVIDHHLSTETLPEAVAVVNPNRIDETSPHGTLAAVGVSFLLVVALNRALRAQGFFTQARKEPAIMGLLDLVALGTVCDVMLLTGLNRVLVTQGLKVMAKRQNLGLRVLCDLANLESAPTAYHLGFVLGPRINACGRIGIADYGTTLLSTHDIDEAYSIAQKLGTLNEERKALEKLILDEAMEQAAQLDDDVSMIIVCGEGWHPGVIGIVASRLKEHFNKPAAVIAFDGDEGKASARSVGGVNLGAAITRAKQMDLLIAGGGHAMAAGFTVDRHRLDDFMQYMDESLKQDVMAYSKQRVVKAEGALPVTAMTLKLAKELEQLQPYGNGNPQPRFILSDVLVDYVKPAGTDHLMVMLKDGTIGAAPKRSYKAMAFRVKDTALGEMLLQATGKRLHLLGKIQINLWQQVERVEFIIDDACEV